MPSMQSRQSGYRSSSSLSPTTVGAVIAVHALLGAAILSMTHMTVIKEQFITFVARSIPASQPPKEVKQVKPQQEPVKRESHVTSAKPVIDLPPPPNVDEFVKPDPSALDSGTGGIGTLPTVDKPFDPPPPPILVQAKPDARYAGAFQPPYPAAMLRMQMEGNVTVRVMIGADGRVTDVILVDAIDPAFFEATKRQALNRWRFVPATRDGVPVASERVMTVHFHLTD